MAGALLGVPILVGIGYLVAGASGVVGNAASGAPGRVLGDPQVWRSVLFSLWIAVVGTALALIGAVCIALLFSGNARVDRAVRTIAALPLPVRLLPQRSPCCCCCRKAAGWHASRRSCT